MRTFCLITSVVLLCAATGCPRLQAQDKREIPRAETTAPKHDQDSSGIPKPLIDAKTLAELLSDQNVRVVELGDNKAAFRKAHIPGAVFLHWVDDIIDPATSDRYNLINKVDMEKLLSSLGVQSDSRIVVYDALSSRLSTRFYWSLKYYNHARVHVLDGGREAWVRAGGEMTDEVSNFKPSMYRIKSVNKNYAADMSFIAANLKNRKVTFVDGRPPAQYSGKEVGKVFHTGKVHQKKGHIPGAVHVFWKDNFHENGIFKSPEALAKLYRDRGVSPDNTVITYCNEGLHAAPPWFVLRELLGYDDVRVYDDSMSEWANSRQPVEQGQPHAINSK